MIQHRVLYLSANSKKGGAEQLTLTMAKNHTASWRPEFYFFEEGPFVDEVRASGILAHVSPLPRPRLRKPASLWKQARRIRELVGQREIHLIHSVMGYTHLIGGLAARKSGAAEVWYQHGPTGSLDWLTGLVPTLAILVNSQYTLAREKKYRPRTALTRVVYPGCGPFTPDQKLLTEASTLRDKYSRPGEVVFSLIGRVTKVKGHRLLIEALHRIRKEAPALKLWFVGEPFFAADREFQKEILELAKTLGLERQVIHTGFLENPHAAILASDGVVNASEVAEGFGLSLLEAMHFSKPVIAPKLGGPIELVKDESTGFLFEPGSAQSLAERLLALYPSEERRAEMGKSAHQVAVSRFSTARMVSELEETYREVLDL